MPIKPKPRIVKKTIQAVRVLTFDIERLPGRARMQHRGLTIEGEFWDLNGWKHTTNRRIHPDDVLEWPRTICAAARWYGEKEVMFAAEWESGHEAFTRTMWEWFDQADLIVGHNADRFDVKLARSGWLEYGWSPPKPSKVVDTLKIARSEFGMESNTLDSLCKRLGVNAKTDKYEVAVARAAVEGDTKAQKRIKSYNQGDIRATEELYDRLRPYIKNHPHLSMWSGSEWGCPNCGFEGIAHSPTGEAYANVTKYRSYVCGKCGMHIRGNRKLQDPTQTRVYR